MTEFLFSDDAPSDEPTKPSVGEPWHILVVDDEPSVHDVTRLTLNRLNIFDKPIKLHSAFSGKEAREILTANEVDFCMAFVDVVMETQNSGLDLVDWIRQELNNEEIRLVLRTGQAGMAPETEVIRKYDINDYRSKTELTAQSLQTCVFNAVRGYRDISSISKSLKAFRKLIDTSATLLQEDNLHNLAASAFEGLLSVLNTKSSSLYITRREENDLFRREEVMTGTGDLDQQDLSLAALPQDVQEQIETAYRSQESIITPTTYTGYFSTSRDSASVLYVEFEADPSHFTSSIVEIFATQAVLIYENLSRQIQLENTQKELLYIVGDAIEARSLETGNHVKRVALFCEFFAQKLDLGDSYISAIKTAAPLHDIGKIAIPETILHKPGKLTPEEWEVMKTHAELGGQILRKSKLPVATLGARLAHSHHENWDGSGYPDGLSGREIPMEARIMAIADVFDALGAKRSYKEPWPDDKIHELIMSEKGKKFDPGLVDIFEANFEELVELRNQYPD